MKPKVWQCMVASCLYWLCSVSTAETLTVAEPTVTNPTRAFGYSLGDIVEQKVLLRKGGETLTLIELPVEQREGRWVTRRKVSVSADGQLLTMRYQVVNAPPDVRAVSLPELALQSTENVEINIPAWEFTIAPLIPASTDPESRVPLMQDDWRPQLPTGDVRMRHLKKLGMALAATLLSWLLWLVWRNWREANTLPFVQAYNKLRHVKTKNASQDEADSWLILHRAFDQSAGRSIAAGSVPALLARVPWLKPMEADISQFFDRSSARFFSAETSQQSFDLKALAKRLYLAEKQHTSKHSSG